MSQPPDARAALALPADEVHVWYTLTDALNDPSLLARYRALMSDEERARCDRYHFEHSRVEYTITRALVRTTLSRYAPSVAPGRWTFRANSYGRPEIAGPDGVAWPRFNLSNTRGLIACAVAREGEVGVDVEDASRPGETVEIADRFFSAREVADLHALPDSERRARFFAYWTLKEAYIKARGMGLSIPLEQFSFLLDPPGTPVRVAFDPRLGDREEGWEFRQFTLSPRHATAAAARLGAGVAPVRFVLRPVVPLVDPSPA